MLPELFDLYKLWYKLEDVNQIDLKPRGRDKVKIIPFDWTLNLPDGAVIRISEFVLST